MYTADGVLLHLQLVALISHSLLNFVRKISISFHSTPNCLGAASKGNLLRQCDSQFPTVSVNILRSNSLDVSAKGF